MNKAIKVFANVQLQAYVDPTDVLNDLRIIPKGDWIIEKNGKYIQMEEVPAVQHSFDSEVGEVTKEIYELYKAQKLLIEYLRYKK